MALVDLDGDGVTDAVRGGAGLECFFNDAERGWERVKRVDRRSFARLPSIDLSDPRVKWADLNGDGLRDLVLIMPGWVEYWPSMGHGNFGPKVVIEHGPRLPLAGSIEPPSCASGGTRQVIAVLGAGPACGKILRHLGQPDTAVTPGPARLVQADFWATGPPATAACDPVCPAVAQRRVRRSNYALP